ncbi:HYDIN/VesB/CFA65-like Ig-like domain-containing protein [Plasmodiophora brassicae]
MAAEPSPGNLTRQQRIAMFGIDCGSSLVWRGWTIGGQFNKVVTFRNVSSGVKTLSYKLPSTKTFYMEYPQPVKLHPGMSFSTTVSFRPTAFEAYFDVIEVTTNGDTFLLPIRACIPGMSMTLPPAIDFSFQAVGSSVVRAFSITNSGDLDFHLAWDIQEPFRIEPATMLLESGKTVEAQCHFNATVASVFSVRATCTIKHGDLQRVHHVGFSAISKYPHVIADVTDIDFGRTAIGKVVRREVSLRNVSPVPAQVTIRPVQNDHAPVFVLKLPTKTIPGEGHLVVPVVYTPHTPDAAVVDHFEIACTGGNTTVLTCRASSLMADYTIDVSSVDFGDVELGGSAHRNIVLSNMSKKVMAFFRFEGGHGAFRFSPAFGEIRPGLTACVKVSFHPGDAINFYERAYVVVEHGAPQQIDLLGTCFSEHCRPAPFTQDQVDAYLRRCAVGLGGVAPETVERHQAEADAACRLTITNSSPASARFDALITSRDRAPVTIVEAVEGVDFGSCPTMAGTQTRVVHVRNNSDSKICVVWEQPSRNGTFIVAPRQRDIRSLAMAQFQVLFRPQHDNYYYSAQLTCDAYFKVNRSFRLVSPASFTPPWHLTVPVLGNTFRPAAVQFLPSGGFRQHRVEFPPTRPNSPVYLAVRLSNTSNAPMHFRFTERRSPNGSFIVHPVLGAVDADSFVVVTFGFMAGGAGASTHSFVCIVNNAHDWRVDVAACAHRALVVADNDGRLYFPPTCIGNVAQRPLTLFNRSRVPTKFRVEVPDEIKDVLHVSPSEGEIGGNDRQECVWKFTPNAEGPVKARLSVELLDDDNVIVQHVPIRVRGMSPVIAAEIEEADGTNVPGVVGDASNRRIRVINSSDVDVTFTLASQAIDGEVTVEPATVAIAGRASLVVDVWVTLWARSAYRVRVTCSGGSGGTPASVQKELCHCVLDGDVVLPVARIVDVRCDDFPLTTSWRLANPDPINALLDSELSPMELKLRRDGPSARTPSIEDLHNALPSFDMRLMPGLLGQPPSELRIRVGNAGRVPFDWDLRGPATLDLDHELWVDPEQLSEQERQYQEVVKARVLTFSPTHGHLGVGEHVDIVVGSSHVSIGTPALALVFDVDRGKKVVWHVSSETVFHSIRRLTFLSSSFDLHPMPIGLQADDVPVQTYRLFNNCPSTIAFRIDNGAWNALNKASCEYPVLECLDLDGTIDPHSYFDVRIRFRPLQAIEYRAVLSIDVVDGDTAADRIEFRGVGHHPKATIPVPVTSRPVEPVPLPRQVAVLSPYVLDFSSVHPHSVTHKVALLENRSAVDIAFEVAEFGRSASMSHVVVEPCVGHIPAGHRCLLHVMLRAGSAPEFLSGAFRCTVTAVGEGDVDAQDPSPTRPRVPVARQNTARSRLSCATRTLDAPVVQLTAQMRSRRHVLWMETTGRVESTGAPGAFLAPCIDYDSKLEDAAPGQDLVEEIRKALARIVECVIDKDVFTEAHQGKPVEIPYFVHLPKNAEDGERRADRLEDVLGQVTGNKLERHAVALMAPAPVDGAATHPHPAMNSSRFQSLTQRILHETVFNLISEIDSGEFRLDAAPRDVVVKGLTFQ